MWLGVENATRAAGCLIAAAIVAAVAVCICAAPIWRLYAWLPAESLRSDRLRITHALATRWLHDVPDIILVGGSQVREIVPDDEFASAQLSAACGRPVRFLNAASSAQLMETSWAIVDHFAARPPALVVIGTNLWRVTDDATSRGELARSLFLLPRAHTMPADARALPMSLMAREKARLGIASADVLTALGFGSDRAFVRADAFQARQHQYLGPGWTPERKTIDIRFQILESREVPDSALQANVESYREFAASLAARGSRTSFLVTPYSPEAGEPLREWESRLSAALESLSRAGAVLDLRNAPDLVTADFFDTVHLVSSGRRKLWPTIKADLLSQLPGCHT